MIKNMLNWLKWEEKESVNSELKDSLINKTFLGDQVSQLNVENIKDSLEIKREVSTFGEHQSIEIKSKIDDIVKNKYKPTIGAQDIVDFHNKVILMTVEHVKKTEFGTHLKFIKEIEYFIHYILVMLQDDFFLGDKRLKGNMTKLDDYIFSQYKRVEKLQNTIKKVIALSYTQRFTSEPKANLLAYFVFLEENGLDLIELLNDFYIMLEKSQKRRWFGKNNIKLNKSYMKKEIDSESKEISFSKHTLVPLEPSFNDEIKNLHKGLYEDSLKFISREPEIEMLKRD